MRCDYSRIESSGVHPVCTLSMRFRKLEAATIILGYLYSIFDG